MPISMGVAGRGGARRRQRRRSNKRMSAQADKMTQEKDVAVAAAQTEGIQSNPTPSANNSDQDIEKLEKLAELKEKGILTEEEFQAKKKQILGL